MEWASCWSRSECGDGAGWFAEDPLGIAMGAVDEDIGGGGGWKEVRFPALC